MRSMLTTLFLLIFISTSFYSQIFVAPDGDDTNPGSIDQPLASMQKAQELVSAGDTVYIRGGSYDVTEDQISQVVQDIFACITYLDKRVLPHP